MPTFQTIRIHPDLHQRLVTESSSSGEYQVIETPQALLSRNPTYLRLLDGDGLPQSVGLHVVQTLRHDVAKALITQSEMGKRAREIQETIERNVKIKGNDDDSERLHNDDDVEDTPGAVATIRFPGTVTLQQLVKYDELLRTSKPIKISTGCPSVDDWLNNDPRGLVTQIAGPSASGKTQLVLQLLARSSDHACQYWSSCPALQPLAKRLQELSPACENRLNEITLSNRPEVLVIDSLSTCLTNVDYHDGKLRQQIRGTLRSVAQHYNIAIFLVNGTVGASKNDSAVPDEDDDEEEEVNDGSPTLHRSITSCHKAAFSWLKAEDIRIWMEATGTLECRMAQIRLEGHPTRRVGRSEVVSVCINSAGVTELPSK